MTEEQDVSTRISRLVGESITRLSPHLAQWARAHLVDPRRIALVEDLHTGVEQEYWLVTDHVGSQDSAHRVVFDPRAEKFGLECTLSDGTHWFTGIYGDGSFATAIECM